MYSTGRRPFQTLEAPSSLYETYYNVPTLYGVKGIQFQVTSLQNTVIYTIRLLLFGGVVFVFVFLQFSSVF